MKSLFITILIVAAAVLGYDYYLAPPQARVIFARPPAPPPPPPPPSQPVAVEAPAPPKKRSKAPQAEPPPAPPKDPMPKSAVTLAAEAAVAAKTESGRNDTSGFVPPHFYPIEMLTGNWRKIPATAFPKPVKLVKDASLKMQFGTSVVKAGTAVVALKMENGLLIIAPADKSPARGTVAVDDTDLKPRLMQLYEKWKVDRTAEARKSFAERLRNPKPVVADAGPAVDGAGKPVAAADGTYPLLMAQLRTGSPSEITPLNITKWQEPVLETYKGKPTWAIEVSYKTKTLFGDLNVDSLAHVQNGKVIDWVFKGSGEAIP